MLLSVVRIGATRQILGKTVALLGADPALVARHTRSLNTESVEGVPGLFAVSRAPVWLGTHMARDEAFANLASTIASFGKVAEDAGGFIAPPGVGLSGLPALLGGDTHVLETLSSIEQEVLVNLLRTYVPALIAMTGRGVTAAGLPRDRVGSRWLAASRSHLATRYLASTDPEHLERVKAELRRRDGIERIDRMDIAPGEMSDGSTAVIVRCIDSAPTLAAARAHGLVLAAFALRARRMVRDGRREGNVPRRELENNRARAVADGLRARFETRNRPTRRQDNHHRDHTEARVEGARNAVRAMLASLCQEFANLEATPEELAPVLLPVELPRLGLRHVATESELLASWSSEGNSVLKSAVYAGLIDRSPGGPLLEAARQAAPGRVSVVLGTWRSMIEDPRPQRGQQDQRHRRDRPKPRGKKAGRSE